MNNKIKYYSVAWLVALIIFNVFTFVVPSAGPKYTESFWIGYIAITIAFAGQLVCAVIALREKNGGKLFYKISLITISYIALIAMLIAGALCMAISTLPYWVGIVVIVLILGFSAIAVVRASMAISEVERIDQKVKDEAFFIRTLTIDADAVVTYASLPELKEAAKKVYDAIRYSDPMSSPALTELQAQISDKFNEFSLAVKSEDADKAKSAEEELLLLIRNRNQKLKLLK